MPTHFYRAAFEATATTRVMLFGKNNAMVEGDFVGKRSSAIHNGYRTVVYE
jgi:hypothetical protein